MKLLKKYTHRVIYDLDEDAKDFCKFLNKNFKNKEGCHFHIAKDNGSYNAPSGYVIDFDAEQKYVTAMDLLKIWKFVEK